MVLLGTLRRDGSPRISPVEPYVARGQLMFGAMTWSGKANDLLRDPRCVLHSTITAPDAGEPELKAYGLAALATTRSARHAGRLVAPRAAHGSQRLRLDVTEAVLIDWDLEARPDDHHALVASARPSRTSTQLPLTSASSNHKPPHASRQLGHSTVGISNSGCV